MKLKKLLKVMHKSTSVILFDEEKGRSLLAFADEESVSEYHDYKVTNIENNDKAIIITLKQSESSQDVEEDKLTFVKELGESLHKCADRTGIEKLRYVRDQHNEFVLIKFGNGLQKKVCVTGDSCLAIMNDIYKALR